MKYLFYCVTADKMTDLYIYIFLEYTRVGFYIGFSKIRPPLTTTIFLDMEIDTAKLQLYLPQEKIAKLTNILCDFLNKRKSTHKELE